MEGGHFPFLIIGEQASQPESVNNETKAIAIPSLSLSFIVQQERCRSTLATLEALHVNPNNATAN